jgi:hypothetical protein|nr:MAG TPA: hypothetical protein [Caudoviricetes sp.]
MIARKDALIKYGVFPSKRGQRCTGTAKKRSVWRNYVAKSENGRNAQQINIYFNNSIFDLNKAHGNNTCIRRAAERTRYSFSESYSKQVMYLPPFPMGNGDDQERQKICCSSLMPPFLFQ